MKTAHTQLFLPAVLLLLVLFSAPAYSASPQESINQLVDVFAHWNSSKVTPELSAAAEHYIDYATMAELALGEDQWKQLTPGQREHFIVAFRQLIEQRYYVRWHRIFKSGKLHFDSEDPGTAGDSLVKTTVSSGENTQAVIWRMRRDNGNYKVISLATEQRDLLTILQPRLDKVLAKRGFNGLVAWLQTSSKP